MNKPARVVGSYDVLLYDSRKLLTTKQKKLVELLLVESHIAHTPANHISTIPNNQIYP